MALFTPGVRFIASSLLVLCSPSLVALYLYRTQSLEQHFNIRLPFYAYVSFGLLFLPFLLFVRITTVEIKQRIEAYNMGARLAPRVPGVWPANLDVLVLMHQKWKTGYPGDGLLELTENLGSVFNMKVLWTDMLFTTNPEHIQQILATDFNNYVKGARFQYNMSGMLGVGVFNADGDMWKFHRQMTRPFFTRDRISHFELFDRHAETVVSVMRERVRQGVPLDFQDLMGKFTIDSATEFLFGHCVDSLKSPLAYPHSSASQSRAPQQKSLADQFVKAFLEAQEGISVRERTGVLWPLLEIFEDKVEKPMKIVSALIDPIVAEAITNKKAKGSQTTQRDIKDEVREDETLLEHLVDITEDPVVLKDATLNILIAGRDTTAATLTFIMYFLATHPHVTKKLRKEVLEVAGTAAEGRSISWDLVKSMKYLRAVINETLRVYPVVPFNVRESIKATTWPSPEPGKPPIYIPAGAKVPYSVFLMHRRKDLWGPDADEFDPERFLDHRLKRYLAPRPFIFLPFNAGPRICLGQQFAYNEMSLILIRLLQSFSSFTFLPKEAPPEFQTPREWEGSAGRKGVDKFFPKMTITMYTGGGLWINAEEAKDDTN